MEERDAAIEVRLNGRSTGDGEGHLSELLGDTMIVDLLCWETTRDADDEKRELAKTGHSQTSGDATGNL